MNINCKHHDHRPIPKEDFMDIKKEQLDPEKHHWYCLKHDTYTSDHNAGLWHRDCPLMSLHPELSELGTLLLDWGMPA